MSCKPEKPLLAVAYSWLGANRDSIYSRIILVGVMLSIFYKRTHVASKDILFVTTQLLKTERKEAGMRFLKLVPIIGVIIYWIGILIFPAHT
jgi:hypothetical protein